MKRWVWELICTDDKGWGDCDSLWSPDYSDRSERLFGSRREADATAQQLRADWRTIPECAPDERPVFAVERRSVYEWLWSDDDDEIEHIVDLAGAPVVRDECPPAHRAWLIAQHGGRANDLLHASAALAGASSATHTLRFLSGAAEARANEVREWPTL